MPNSRRRASTSAPNDEDNPVSPMTTATASSAYVTANVRSKMRSEIARISPGVATASRDAAGQPRPRCARAAAPTLVPGASQSGDVGRRGRRR